MTNLYDATLDEYLDKMAEMDREELKLEEEDFDLDEHLDKMAEMDREELKLEEEDFEESDFIL